MGSSYTLDDKKLLASKIHKIKRKDILVKIFGIITSKNPKIDYVEKENGIWIFFDSCTDDTYEEITDLLKRTKKTSPITNVSLVSTECLGTECIDRESTEIKTSSRTKETHSEPDEESITIPKLKLSNQEKTIIRRKIYNETLDKHDDIVYQKFV